MKDLISVIVPVFNVEDYLYRTLSSLREQTYHNLEVLLINDGSTDYSNEICDYFTEIDNRFVHIKKTNGGLSSARNLGLDKSSGKFICFLDSDDWIDKHFVEALYLISKMHNADVSTCLSRDVYFREKNYRKFNDGKCYIYSGEDAFVELFKNKNVRFEVWNKLFRATLFDNLRFKEAQIYEDVYVEKNIFSRMNKIAFLNEQYHYYLKDRDGNTNAKFSDKNVMIFSELDDFENFLKVSNYEKAQKHFYEFCVKFCFSLYFLSKKAGNSNSQYIKNKYKYYYKKALVSHVFGEDLNTKQKILYKILYRI